MVRSDARQLGFHASLDPMRALAVIALAGAVGCTEDVLGLDSVGDGGPSEKDVLLDAGRRDADNIDLGTPCRPRPEVCNQADDDCDGRVDEGLDIYPLAPPTLVRDDEGSAGACSICAWAAPRGLIPTAAGFVAAWQLAFDGARPVPNAYRRRLNEAGIPSTPVEPLLAPAVLVHFGFGPNLERRIPIVLNERSGARDVLGLRRLNEEGDPLPGRGEMGSGAWLPAQQVQIESLEGGRLATARVVREGLRVYAWDGLEAGVEAWTLDEGERNGFTYLGLSQRAGQLVVAAPRFRFEDGSRELLIRAFDGQLTGPRQASKQIDLEGLPGQSYLFSDDEGFLLLGVPQVGAGYLSYRLSPSLRLGEAQRWLDDTSLSGAGSFAARPGGGAVVVDSVRVGEGQEWYPFVATVAPDGAPESVWRGPRIEDDSEWIAAPQVAVLGGRIWALYAGVAVEGVANQLWVRPFGCR